MIEVVWSGTIYRDWALAQQLPAPLPGPYGDDSGPVADVKRCVRERPGLTARQISAAIGVCVRTTNKALALLEGRGEIVREKGMVSGRFGRVACVWRSRQ